MSPSAPIAIPSARSSTPSSVASSPLYVPVHKRTSSSRSSSSTRSDSGASSSSSEHDTPSSHPLIYSREALLSFGQSPLARLPVETRESLRSAFPELMTNRKQRKAIEYRNTHAAVAAAVPTTTTTPVPTVRVQPRRNRPAGRAPERRRNATKVVDEASWRGRRIIAEPIPV